LKAERSPEARALETLRRDRGMTQSDLSEASGAHKSTVSICERGERSIAPDKLAAMLNAMAFPPRAWEATVRHFVWLDYLSGASVGDLPTAEAVSESFGREVERHVLALLRVLRPRAH